MIPIHHTSRILRLTVYDIDDQMEGDDAAREEDNDREGSEGEGDGGDEDGGQAKQEYIKKEFVARPYVSPWGTDVEVKSLIVKNSR